LDDVENGFTEHRGGGPGLGATGRLEEKAAVFTAEYA
jgi:hypothetical protein